MNVCLTGENDVLRDAELARMIAEFEKDYGDMAVERLDGEDVSYERMTEAAASLPFLVPRKLVILRSPSANKDFAEKLEEFMTNVADTNTIVILEPKLDKRLGYYKQLKKLTDFREFKQLDMHGLVQFAVEYAKKQGGSISSSDAGLLIERCGTNQLALRSELDKLMLQEAQITGDSIELLTEKNPQSSIFELLDAAFTGNKKRMADLYAEQRSLQVEPQQILAMLVWQLNILAIVKSAGQRSQDEIAREAKLSPFTVKKTASLARRVSHERIRSLISELRVLDIRLKTESIIPDEALQYYMLSLST